MDKLDKYMEATTELLGDWKWTNNQSQTARLIERMEEQGISHEETMNILYSAFMLAMDEQKRRSPAAGL